MFGIDRTTQLMRSTTEIARSARPPDALHLCSSTSPLPWRSQPLHCPMTDTPKRKTLYLLDGPNWRSAPSTPSAAWRTRRAPHQRPVRLHQHAAQADPRPRPTTWRSLGPVAVLPRPRVRGLQGTRPTRRSPARQMPHFAASRGLRRAIPVPRRLRGRRRHGTLARRHQDDLDVVLVSSDKDLMQLVSDHVSIYDSMNDRRIARPRSRKKFGCAPTLVPDALASGATPRTTSRRQGIGEKGVKACSPPGKASTTSTPTSTSHPARDPGQGCSSSATAPTCRSTSRPSAPTRRWTSPSTTSPALSAAGRPRPSVVRRARVPRPAA